MTKKSKSLATVQQPHLLRTKLSIPRPHPDRVERPWLIERLNECLQSKLCLISASAGSGKTTLLSTWVSQCPWPVTWVSLDARDNDPIRFWSYFITALQTFQPEVGKTTLAMLQAPQPAPPEATFTELVNEIDTITVDFLLVLDDYHTIQENSIHLALSFLLEHLPPHMHLVIAGRSDPPLPLSMLRVRRELVEIKGSDLRFSVDETAEFLNQVMLLGLTPEDVAAIENTTEGWIAGIQLAALSLQGIQDASSFIRSFTGRQRYIFDYLAQEVLNRQPKHIQEFLLRTSILDRFCSELCDEVIGDRGQGIGADGVTGRRGDGVTEKKIDPRIFANLHEEEKTIREHSRKFADTSISPSHPLSLSPSPSSTPIPLPLSPSRSQEILAYLDRSNLFLIPLDDRREWYRYHHLFADFLKTQLELKASPEEVTALHLRAGEWLAQHQFYTEAVGHALQAQNYAQATIWLALASPDLFLSNQFYTLLNLLSTIPEEHLRQNLTINMIYVWALLATSQFDKVEARLQQIEDCLGVTVDSGCERKDLSVEQRGGLGEIAAIRANLAFHRMDLPTVFAVSQQALDYLAEDVEKGLAQSKADLLAVTSFNRALAYEFGGDIPSAIKYFDETLVHSRATNNINLIIFASSHLAQLQALQGQLWQAQRTYSQALQAGTGTSVSLSPTSGTTYAGLGNILYEWNELNNATSQLEKGMELGRKWRNWETLIPAYLGAARVKAAQGDFETAVSRVDELLKLAEQLHPQWGLSVVEAFRAELWVRQGNNADAERWWQNLDWDVDSGIPYAREAEALHVIRVLLGLQQPDTALHWIEQLQGQAETSARQRRLIEILILKALALQAKGELKPALATLERVLPLAEPEGYIRVFLDAGAPMAQLLEIAAKRGLTSNYTQKLLEYFSAEQKPEDETPPNPIRLPVKNATRPTLTTPTSRVLSERELDVLGLMAEGMTNQQIADTLVVSLNTVKTHVKNILARLDVRNRTQATAKARELGILDQ